MHEPGNTMHAFNEAAVRELFTATAQRSVSYSTNAGTTR